MRAAHPLWHRALSMVLPAVVACGDGGPTFPGDGMFPEPAPVLLDTSDYLLEMPYPGDADSFSVTMPAGRTVGVIIDSPGPIGVVYGPGGPDVVYSFDGLPVAAIATHTSAGELPIEVRHVVPHFNQMPYHLRIIAVDTMPEHVSATSSADGVFRSEWIDPPLDIDVYTIDFTGVERYYVELQSMDDDVRVSARVLTPGGVAHFAILATSDGISTSPVFTIEDQGAHELLIYAAGLVADVETRYRFRVVEADAPENASADR